jgi:hypothetical protein
MVNVGTPRFYVNVLEWLSINNAYVSSSLLNTLPVNPVVPAEDIELTVNNVGIERNGFIAILGHENVSGGSSNFAFRIYSTTGTATITPVVNIYSSTHDDASAYRPEHNGFSIGTFAEQGSEIQTLWLIEP